MGQVRRLALPIPASEQSVNPPRVVSVDEMTQIDQAAIDRFGIPRLLLMEQAGLAVARAVQSLTQSCSQRILVCCGSGYNGGDGLCAARHLADWGYHPQVVLASPAERLREEPAIYARILKALGVPILEIDSRNGPDVFRQWLGQAGAVIDALLGIGLKGALRPSYATLITLLNQSRKPIVSVDIPSGLDADTGMPHGAGVMATVTVTFGLPKQGMVLGQGPKHVGQLLVERIGIPHVLLALP